MRSAATGNSSGWSIRWDGTREFIAGNNEFTINIALMENNVCAAAVIYVPYLHKIYFADRGFGSYVRDGVEPSADAAYTFYEIKQGARRRRSSPNGTRTP